MKLFACKKVAKNYESDTQHRFGIKLDFIRHWGVLTYIIVLRMNIIMMLNNKELILWHFALAQKQGPIVLPQPSCDISILPKKQSRNRSMRRSADRMPPLGWWLQCVAILYKFPKRNAPAFFYIFYVPTVFLTLYAGSRDFQIWYSRRSRRVILMLFFFGTFPNFTCLVLKRNLSPVTLFQFEAQITFGVL